MDRAKLCQVNIETKYPFVLSIRDQGSVAWWFNDQTRAGTAPSADRTFDAFDVTSSVSCRIEHWLRVDSDCLQPTRLARILPLPTAVHSMQPGQGESSCRVGCSIGSEGRNSAGCNERKLLGGRPTEASSPSRATSQLLLDCWLLRRCQANHEATPKN